MNILRDRGLVKWQSAFMMPEHLKLLKQYKEDDNKIEKPSLDEQELEEIQLIVMDSLYFCYPVKITIWDYGYYYHVSGVVEKVDLIHKNITLRTDIEKKKIEIEKITRVTKI